MQRNKLRIATWAGAAIFTGLLGYGLAVWQQPVSAETAETVAGSGPTAPEEKPAIKPEAKPALDAPGPGPQDWPHWRGPTRDGVSVGQPWPDSLAADKLQKLWHVDLGPGYPGPLVCGSRVFVAETKGAQTEIVRALDRATGRELWSAQWAGALSVPFFAARNGSWIRSTPACDGPRLFVAGMRDVLVCLDAATGQERWRVDFVAKYQTPLPAFGFVCSPLVDDTAVYVQAGAAFCKLDKVTGEVLWRTLQDNGGIYGSAFSSPVFATLQGQSQILVQTRDKLAGVDPPTGRVLWERQVPAFRGMNILTPTVHNGAVFTSTYQNRSFLFEVTKTPATGQFGVTPTWDNKVQGYMSSPVVVGDHVYMHLQNRRFACLHLPSGRETWITSDRYGEYCSLVVRGDKILALDNRGILLLIRANPQKFELLDQATVSAEETWGHLAVAGDELYVRELNGLTAYRWR